MSQIAPRLVSPFFLIAALAGVAPLAAQTRAKRALTHEDYDGWRSIPARAISRDGRHLACAVWPQVGDGEVVVRDTVSRREIHVPLGAAPLFTADGRFVLCRLEVPRAVRRAHALKKLKARKAKAKGHGKEQGKTPAKGKKSPDEDAPRPGLAIVEVASGKVTRIERVSSFKVPEEGPAFVLYRLEKQESPKPSPAARSAKKNTEKPAKHRVDGAPVVILDLASGKSTRIEGVTSFGVTKKNGFAWFARNSRRDDPKIERGLFAIHLGDTARTTLVAGAAEYRAFAFDRAERRLAFLSNRAHLAEKKPSYDLYAWDFRAPRASRIVSHAGTPGFPHGRTLGKASRLQFCRDGGVLMFDAVPLPRPDLPVMLSEDKVVLDLWHWRDGLLQPMQAKRAAAKRGLGLACAWRFERGRLVVLAHHPSESVRFAGPDGSRAIVQASKPYMRELSWDGRYADYFVVHTIDGSRKKLLDHLRGQASTSPDGRYLLFFEDAHWHALDLATGKRRNLTSGLGVHFDREDHDTPSPPRPYGIAGWTRGDGAVLLYDRFDIWEIAPDRSSRTCITRGFGRAHSLQLRYARLDPEERFVPLHDPILLSATDLETMASGYFTTRIDAGEAPRRLIMKDKAFGGLAKARDADRLFFTMTTFAQGPDLWTASLDFTGMRRLTDINPQQRDIRWGKAELVRWRSSDGIPLKGVLIKPDGFDPARKYPLMVYIYEKLSRGLHRYGEPKPRHSVTPAWYVSNGYLWFMPDIVYREGYPGASCLHCVVPGVQSLLAKGFVDPDAIGIAGHSWGGYQSAFLITRTDLFKAAESGAPVSDMVSAYGGIRWGSGMSRAFQYEHTQSRIGGSLWRYPMRYIENSPVFAADRVHTPIMMLHCDQDGAVPWYQGIEYFCALRRLGKEAYMFDYVGEGHHLAKRANALDYTIRMQLFFDHHLRGKPAPRWMREGVAYVDREREKLEFRGPAAAPVEASSSKPPAQGGAKLR